MRHSKSRFFTLLLSTLVVMGLAVALIVAVVYQQVTRELRTHAYESVENRIGSVQRSVVNRLESIAFSMQSTLRLLSNHSPETIEGRSQLSHFLRSHSYVRNAWIVTRHGQTISSAGTDPRRILARMDRRADIERTTTADSDSTPRLLDLPLKDAGGWYIGPAFRDSIGLSTHIPIVVYEFSGVEHVRAGYVIVDLSELIFSFMDELRLVVDERTYPLILSVYDSQGRLVETTLNYLIQRHDPLGEDTTTGRVVPGRLDERRTLTPPDIVSSGPEMISALIHDSRTAFWFGGSVAEPAVSQRVTLLSMQIILIGVVSLVGILALGVLLLRTIERLAAVERQRADLQLRSLQATMSPHFLFNTLDTIVGLTIDRDFDGLLTALRALTRQLGGAVRDFDDVVPLDRELEYLQSYIDIQRYRYRDSFEFQLEVPDQCRTVMIPRFCIQPLVENAFTHSLPYARRPVTIRVVVALEADDLQVSIADDGPGCSEARREEIACSLTEARRENVSRSSSKARKMETHGIGLYSVHRRLAAEYGSCYGIELEPVSHGFAVRVTLPIVEESPRNGRHENQNGHYRRWSNRRRPRTRLSGTRR